MNNVPQRTITEQVLAQVRDLILSGVLEPGSKIDQSALAQRFQTSLVPVREALARLQSSGLVRMIPHRGAFVEGLALEEMRDIYAMREVLEAQAAESAASRLSDDDIIAIENLVQQIEAKATSEDYDAFLRLNREMHFIIYRAAGRRHLLQVIEQLWDHSERYRRMQIHIVPHRAEVSLFEDCLILAACRQRDPESLGTMVRYKIHQTMVGLLDMMQASVPEQEQTNSMAPPPLT